VAKQRSIYVSPDVEERLMAIYDGRLAQWPVPYESVFVESAYGRVHVVVSGPPDAPPVLLLHGGTLSGSVWLYNVEALSRYCRTYAVDHPGEPGRSELHDLDVYPRNARELGHLYAGVLDELELERVHVVGHSNGGFIGLGLAVHEPGRVRKLALLSPAGLLTPRLSMALRALPLRLFRSERRVERMLRWALGDDPAVLEACGAWVGLTMTGVRPRTAPPLAFAPQELASIDADVLLLLGNQDRLVPPSERLQQAATAIPGVRVDVLDAGHMLAIERAEAVNERACAFLAAQ
jgi:pimeloyl-ACP methyl ester carboxylesterase